MPWQNAVALTLRAGNTIINGTGEFVYDGTPALGRLSASIVPGTSTVLDPFGQVALPGESVYQTPITLASPAMSMQEGILIWYSWSGSGWGIGPSIDWTLVNNFIEILGAPVRSFAGTRLNPTIISTDSWTTFVSFGTGFQAGSPAPQQVLMPAGPNNSGCVKLRGQVLATGATAANSTMVVALGGSAVNMSWIVPTNASGYTPPARVITVDTNGNVRLQPTASLNNFVLLDGIEIPLA